MPDVKLDDMASLHAWARLLIHNCDAYMVPEANLQLNLFGTDDSAYLVINQYPDANTTIQYVFMAAEESKEPIQLIFLFDLLKAFSWSLRQLLNWLASASFAETEMGDRLESHGLAIYRTFPQPEAHSNEN